MLCYNLYVLAGIRDAALKGLLSSSPGLMSVLTREQPAKQQKLTKTASNSSSSSVHNKGE